MLVLVIGATLARFVLIYCNWPTTNSDEGNMGLEALHIAYRGELPIFFYGLPYMGPIEAYIAAPLFRLFGVSLFTLRLGLLPLFAFFLICMYYLTALLYTKKFALALVFLLSLGSSSVILLQLKAFGEYPETELFAALIFLLTVWLALTSYSPEKGMSPRHWKCMLVYGCLGLVIGLALWVDFLILPFVVTAGILLLLFCRHELRTWPGLSALCGAIVGALPLIIYNLTAPLSQNSLAILYQIHHAKVDEMAIHHISWIYQPIDATIISLPLATGFNPACSVETFPLPTTTTMVQIQCLAFQGSWGVGCMLLFLIATAMVVSTLWKQAHQGLKHVPSFEERQTSVRRYSQLLLLIGAGLTFFSYATSAVAVVVPVPTARYLICLVVAAPVILWPLWNGIDRQKIWSAGRTPTTLLVLLRGGLLLLIVTMFLVGTIRTFEEIPTAQNAYRHEDALVHDLLHLGARRLYADYWTCNRLTFHSQEQIICSVLDENLQPGFDRYPPYRSLVRASSHPTYVFLLGSQQATTFPHFALAHHLLYHHSTYEGYAVYSLFAPLQTR